jgi:signal transduction histidine kinase
MLIPRRFWIVHREHIARFAASQDIARRMGQRQDVFGLRKNGQEFPADASISKVVVGDATLFSVVLRDITDRKHAEEELRRAVTERDRVLEIVAHDLRNPLSNILLSAGLDARRGEPERRNRRALDAIARAATRMNDLIDDLLDVTRIEAGQLKMELESLRAADLVFEAAEMQTALASSAGIEVRLDLAPNVHALWGHRDRLLQVFENLVGNAIKFTPSGGHITIGAALKDENVLFRVADTGRGIPSESLPHVFDRFWQTKTAGRLGAGLGLAIAKGIVEAHGGRIWVESTPGVGSTFFFTIPKAPSATKTVASRFAA